MGAGYKGGGVSKGSEWAARGPTMAERAIYPVRFSTPKIDEDGNEYVDYTDVQTDVQNFRGPSRYGEEFPVSGRCVGAEDPITLEPYDSARPGLVLQPERGPGHCFQDEPGETGVIQSIWNNGNPSTREALSDENRAYLESRLVPPYPWERFPFRMRLHFQDGSSVEIPCDENVRVSSRDDITLYDAVRSEIPLGVTTIGVHAFSGCTSLASINIPEGVTTIGGYAFARCTSLASIRLPTTLTTIEEYAFVGCTSLDSIIIPEGVTTIGRNAFQNCTSLNSIIFPSSVETYGDDILAGCTSLRRVYLANDSGQQQVDVADLGVNPSVVTIYRYFVLRYAVLHDAFQNDSDSDEDPPAPPDRGVSRSLAAAFESDSDSGDEPPTRRIRTEGALYDWTGGNP